ncbi:MAG: hypothetical protein IKU08_07260 [Clostridia bacterium]|nr:hypothetical protein [Clostridia bacterium]
MKNFLRRLTATALALVSVLSYALFSVNAAENTFSYIYVENTGNDGGVISYRYIDENGNEIVPQQRLTRQRALLPSSYNAVDEGLVTRVKSQGESGVCWAFSAMSLMESDSIAKGYKTLADADFSEAHHTWFTGRGRAESESDLAYGDGYYVEEPYLRGGNWKMSAASLARWTGVANERDFPFYDGSLENMGNYPEAERYNTSSGIIIESAQSLTTAEKVKQWITEHGSATVAFYYDDSCYNYPTSSYCTSTSGTINHQVVVVGWDDNYSASNFGSACTPSGDGAWICKNSWTSYWGDGGYFYISYYDASLSMFAGFTVQKSDDYYKNYTYNGAEWYSAMGLDKPLQVANVFTATGYESLSAIAVQTYGSDIQIKATVYKNIKAGYTSPIKGTASATLETVIANEGYHTIYLDSPVELNPGEIFSVVVRYYNPNGMTYIPVEKNTPDGLAYSSRKDESYIDVSGSGNIWKAASSQGAHNFYIQALTKCNHQLEAEGTEATCTENGSEKIYCTQCGKIEAQRVLKATGHSYGEWSDFRYDISEGRRISECVCGKCGNCMQRAFYNDNVISLDAFIDLLFNKFRLIILKIFSI